MVPVQNAKVKIEIDPDASHSCNHLMCCFGCKCVKHVSKEVGPDSPVSFETTEKVTKTYERHHIHHTPERKPRLLRRSSEIQELSAIRAGSSVDVAVLTKESSNQPSVEGEPMDAIGK